jgi:hypothetical protein
MVDLFKSEQQKNVDFALLQPIKTTGVDSNQGLMLIYDIACQYSVHLRDRIGNRLPAGLTIDNAIGLFHVHAHKEQCFFRYSTLFIPGAGITAGEILESLWSTLNCISPTVRTATLAHRAEMLDDHASDSNHKKLLGMRRYLCQKYRDASDTLQNMMDRYAEQSHAAGPFAVTSWTTQIEQAEADRAQNLDVMDIYCCQIVLESGYSTTLPLPLSPQQLPIHAWLEFTLMVEEKQYGNS